MALFNEILVGRFNGIIHKLLNMKEGAPAPTLATDISAGITLESDRPEWLFLGGTWRGMRQATRALDAGNFSVVGLFNGQATGMIAVVEGVWINNTTAGALAYHVRQGTTTGLGNTGRGTPTDLRWLTKLSACLVGDAVEAALTGTQLLQIRVAAGASQYIPLDVILPSQQPAGQVICNVTVTGDTVNEAVQASFVWTERPVEASETR